MKGFQVSVICHFNMNVFTDLDFHPSYVSPAYVSSYVAPAADTAAGVTEYEAAQSAVCVNEVEMPADEQNNQLASSVSSRWHAAATVINDVMRTCGPSRPDTSTPSIPVTPQDLIPLPKKP